MTDRRVRMNVVFEAVDKAVSKITGIKKSATEVGKELAKARKELKQLNDTQSNVTAFIKLKTQVGESSTKLNEAQAKVRKLATEMRQAEKPTREMERAFNRAKKEAGELGSKVDRDAESLQRLRDRLKEAGIHTRNLADAQKDLKGKIADATGRVDQQKEAYAGVMANGGKAGAKGGPGSFTDKAVKAGLILGTLKEVTDIAGAPIISDASAEEQMTQIGLKANMSREKLAAMREEIQRLAPQVRMLPEQMRGGVDFLAASGVNPEQAMKMMAPLGKAAHANKADINDLAKATNSALSNLKVPLGKDDVDRLKQTTRVLDMMTVAGKEGNFEVADMSRNFPTLTARLASLGEVGVDAAGKLSAAMQVAWIDTGNSDEAANNINNLLMKINAKETIQNFDKMGVNLPKALKKAYAEGKTPLEAIADLTDKALGGKYEKISYLFGDAQAQSGVMSMITHKKEYQRIKEKTLSASSSGEVDRDFVKRSEDVSSRWDRLMSRWDVFKEGIGKAFSGVTKGGLDIADAFLSFKSLDMGLVQAKTQQVAQATTTGLAAGMEQRKNDMALTKYWLTAQDGAAAQQRSVLMGNQVGDGLALGMEQKTGRVKAAADTLAAAAQGQVREKLKIKSPSRVFMAIGGHISSGLAEGIDRTRRAPMRSAARMAAGVAAAGAASMQGPAARPGGAGGAAGGGAGPITLNVYGAQGQSVDDLAQAVMRKLKSAQGVHERSSYEGDR